MTTNRSAVRYIFNAMFGGMGHGQETIGRGDKETSARGTAAAQRQKACRSRACSRRGATNGYTWKGLLDEGGIDALRCAPSRGRPPRLDQVKLESLRQALLQKPTEHGFGTELWTLKRVGVVIQRMHGVKFGQTQIWRLLGALGFSAQKPERRALERSDEVVRGWKRGT